MASTPDDLEHIEEKEVEEAVDREMIRSGPEFSFWKLLAGISVLLSIVAFVKDHHLKFYALGLTGLTLVMLAVEFISAGRRADRKLRIMEEERKSDPIAGQDDKVKQ